MAESPLDRLMRSAMVGLRHAPDYDAEIPERFTRLLAQGEFRSEAERFLHLLTLCQLEQSLSRCPQPDDGFEELPDEPHDLLILLDDGAERLAGQLLELGPRQGSRLLATVLFQRRCALPDALFVGALERGDRHQADLYALAASARSRWMLELTPAWLEQLSGQCGDWIASAQQLLIDQAELDADAQRVLCQAYGSCRPALRQQLSMLIGRLPPLQLFAFVQTCWGSARAEARVALLRLLSGPLDWLVSPEGEAARLWLESLSEERAGSVRQVLMQLVALLAQRMAAERRSGFQTALLARIGQCLEPCILEPTSRKPELLVPETLSAALQSLGIGDSLAPRHPSLGQPAARLGQLLRLAGPGIWAQLMDCPVEEAGRRLLSSRFGAEVAPFVFESLLWHRERQTLGRLRKAAFSASAEGCHGAVLELLGANPEAASWYLETLIELDDWETLDSEAVCAALLAAGASLSEQASRRWWEQRLCQQFAQKRREPEREFCAALLLSLPAAELERWQPGVAATEGGAEEHQRQRRRLLETAQALRHASRTPPGTLQGEPL